MKRTIAAIAVVALFVAAAIAGATAVPDQHTVNDSVAALTRNVGLRSVDVQHHARPMPVLGGLAVVAPLLLFLAGIGLRSGRVPLIGPRRRRVGDAGDDWRALLLGAPPRSA